MRIILPLRLNDCGRRLSAFIAAGLLVAGCAQTPLTELQTGLQTTNSVAPTNTAFTRGEDPPLSESKRIQVIKNPKMAQLLKAGPLGDRTMGNPDAKVTFIEYGSWSCPHCRAFRERTWPEFKRTYIDTGKVFYILREFPIGRSSGNAALVSRCAPKKDYFRLYELYLKHQAEWVSQDVRLDAIYKIAAKTGMSRATFDACVGNEELSDGVKWVKDRGRALGVIGTPTFFINEKRLQSFIPFEELKTHIDPLLKRQVAKKTG